ncbi:hypothetical protein TRAPUB_1797 [Trametes pubescens]|uniref:Uncharacterized protein n=1 Tax=Trametes pubescens TaxID=154538 RepID=A0A1M2VIA6_TRAPU|nr:hypothetical protein TRAPUB_1797 [Trametes pubescens]
MSLSEQRSTGGSISRSGTPQAAGASGQAQQQQSTRLAYQAQWPQDTQALPTGTTYAAPQGWQGATPMQGSSSAGQYGHAQSGGQGYPNAQMVYPQGYTQQQAAYAQSQGGVAVPGGGAQADLYAQGYGMAAQQGFASGTTYNAYGHGVPNMDPTYAYQASQMGAGLPGVDQQGAPYGGQYASQMYFDQSAVQMMSADAAAAQQWAGNTQGYQGHGFPGQ